VPLEVVASPPDSPLHVRFLALLSLFADLLLSSLDYGLISPSKVRAFATNRPLIGSQVA
jgi:hypothetical protein